MPPDVERVDGTFAYPWWQLWPEFQERIFQFAQTYDFLVVTDIANYYDTIPLHALRNAIAAASRIAEPVLDLLFFILETLVWRPYYVPHSGVGLPQINFDAPRLLAHAYLFKVDAELERATSGAFVRWMDDIDAGVDSREAGKALLRRLQAVLNRQGLQLNTSKTRILSAKEAIDHFNVGHNRALTVIANGIQNGANTPALVRAHRHYLRRSFSKFRKSGRIGHWEKVYKRYLTQFGRLRDTIALKDISELLSAHPGMRGAALLYLSRLGYSPKRSDVIHSFLVSGDIGDDGALFEVARCLVAWSVPAKCKQCTSLLKLGYDLAEIRTENPAFRIGAALPVIAKYGEVDELVAFLKEHQGVWQHSGWCSRQVAALGPLLPDRERSYFLTLLQDNGLVQGLQVWANLNRVGSASQLDGQLSSYMYHVPKAGDAFPFSKVLLAVVLLSGKLRAPDKSRLRQHLLHVVQDGRYRYIIRGGRSTNLGTAAQTIVAGPVQRASP